MVYVQAGKTGKGLVGRDDNIKSLFLFFISTQSAFQVSVAANQHLIAQDLLSLGAQLNTVDYWGRSPLHVCAEKGHTLILQVRFPLPIQTCNVFENALQCIYSVLYHILTNITFIFISSSHFLFPSLCHSSYFLLLLSNQKLLTLFENFNHTPILH